MEIRKAKRYAHKIRLGLGGPTGAGKTYTMLRLGAEMARREGGRLLVIDTEHGTASLYADTFDFDVLELDSFAPDRYIEAIHVGERSAEHAVIAVDSLSHAWIGKDGELEQVDRLSKGRENSFTAWRYVTPQHNALVDALVSCKKHLIVTLRSKMDYRVEEQETKDGRKSSVPVKLGMAPVMRDGIEYEMDLYAEIAIDHTLEISKTRCASVDGYRVQKAGEELAGILWEWAQGEAAPQRPFEPQRAAPAPGNGETAPIDQLGEFKDLTGNFDFVGYTAHLKDQTVTGAALAMALGTTAKLTNVLVWNWLKANPGKALKDLTAQAVEAQRAIEKKRPQEAAAATT